MGRDLTATDYVLMWGAVFCVLVLIALGIAWFVAQIIELDKHRRG